MSKSKLSKRAIAVSGLSVLVLGICVFFASILYPAGPIPTCAASPGPNQKPVISTNGEWTIANFVIGVTPPGGSFLLQTALEYITATDLEDGDITDNIIVSGFSAVDVTTPGTYFVYFDVTDSGGLAADTFKREINVRQPGTNSPGRCYEQSDLSDTFTIECSPNTPPTITLLGANPISLLLNATFTDPGATATDTEDGSLTSGIIKTGTVTTTAIGTYTLIYTVTDSGGLSASTTRTVNVTAPTLTTQCSDGIDNDGDGMVDMQDPGCSSTTDDSENQPPVITVLGDNPLVLSFGISFNEPSATVSDPEDGNINSRLVIGGDTINTSLPRDYIITYNATDSKGLAAEQKTRAVQVQAQPTGAVITMNDSALRIYDEQAQDQGNGAALVTWKTDAPATSRVAYGTTTVTAIGPSGQNYGYGFMTYEDSALLMSHSMLIFNIGQGAQYYFRPFSNNSAYKPAVGKELTLLSVQPLPVTPTAPVTPTLPPVNLNPVPTPATPLTPTECNYLLEYLRMGDANNPVEVRKLQVFLKEREGFNDLAITNIFDQATLDAVNIFQMRYKQDALSPWGYEQPTGYVYITTKKKVNELYCQKPFPLTLSQQAEIENFKLFFESIPETTGQGSIGQGPVEENISAESETVGSGETAVAPSPLTVVASDRISDLSTSAQETQVLAKIKEVIGEEGTISEGILGDSKEVNNGEKEREGFNEVFLAGLQGVVSSARPIYWLIVTWFVLISASLVLFFIARRRRLASAGALPSTGEFIPETFLNE